MRQSKGRENKIYVRRSLLEMRPKGGGGDVMEEITFLSCFSGIEAASAAWVPIGWKCVGVAELEAFPCAVLNHHYPDVPNLGDVTAEDFLQRASVLRPNVLVGGPPCQDFSVAGLRAGIFGDRGNLTLRWVQIIHAVRPIVAVTENVPGWLSANDGHAFGAFLAGLVGHDTALIPPKECGGRWTDAGMVDGPIGRAAWRIFDAQYFGLAQRRRRVFVVFCPRGGLDPAAILLERKGMFRDSPPSREAGKGIAPTISSRPTGGGGLGTDFDLDGGLICPAMTGGYGHSAGRDLETEGALIASTLRARDNARGVDSDCTDTLIPVAVDIRHGTTDPDVTMTLQSAGIGDDRGMCINAIPHVMAYGGNNRSGPIDIAIAVRAKGGTGHGDFESETFIASSCKDHGADAGDLSPTLRAMGHAGSHANAGGQDDVAFVQNQRDEVRMMHVAGAMSSQAVMKQQTCVALNLEISNNDGVRQGVGSDASPSERNAIAILRRVRSEIGEEAFTKWGLGVFNSLQPEKILRSGLHGKEFRPAAFSRCWVVCCTLGSPFSRAEGAMHSLREACGEGCPPQGWEPLEQHSDQLGAYLSELSQPGAQAERFVRDLWQADEGPWLLRQALSAVQEVRRPPYVEGKSTHSGSAVRRLTATECEFLQGFPRNYTLIPYRGKPAADGPRYKALGNSMAVPVMRWIGKRIAAQHALALALETP